MTSLRQIAANRRNASKSTGPTTEEGKQRSRCNAVRHGLTAETVIGGLEDTEDYKAFEGAIAADYDAQSAVERELVLRLASLLWRLRRAISMETGLFEIQAEQLGDTGSHRSAPAGSQQIVSTPIERLRSVESLTDRSSSPTPEELTDGEAADIIRTVYLARCFLRLANLHSFPIDRLSRYEATLWRQVAQTQFALDVLDRRKPHERRRRFRGTGIF
jgi:hypothetical protein